MANGIGAIEIRRSRGKLVVQGLGQTPRGQRFIRTTVVLNATEMHGDSFKKEMATVVEEMMAQEALPL